MKTLKFMDCCPWLTPFTHWMAAGLSVTCKWSMKNILKGRVNLNLPEPAAQLKNSVVHSREKVCITILYCISPTNVRTLTGSCYNFHNKKFLGSKLVCLSGGKIE